MTSFRDFFLSISKRDNSVYSVWWCHSSDSLNIKTRQQWVYGLEWFWGILCLHIFGILFFNFYILLTYFVQQLVINMRLCGIIYLLLLSLFSTADFGILITNLKWNFIDTCDYFVPETVKILKFGYIRFLFDFNNPESSFDFWNQPLH